MKTKLGLPRARVAYARAVAAAIVDPIHETMRKYTTVSVERATLRLLGADGVSDEDVPVPNLAVDSLGERLDHGASRYYLSALIRKGWNIWELNRAIADGMDLSSLTLTDLPGIVSKAEELLAGAERRIMGNAAMRRARISAQNEQGTGPLLYVIVASGNIYEDVKQARAAAMQGADAIAVIRSTAQSLLDYVPYGATTEGFGGTFATQENFRIMRAALDEACEKTGRYVRLVNYCSGLCMPEIAVMGALERLDMMLNDSMYGVLFRDINMTRTFVDQNFSRMVNAFAEIMINTGEDNYLTTSDAYENACTVLASQFINEKFAMLAGLPAHLIGLGHAFEIDPSTRNGFLYELAQAQLTREVFPDCPLKYMPPTRFMTGDIFKGHVMDAMFNFVSKATRQTIHLLGMLTEGIHTPFLQDRYLALENAKYVMNSVEDFYEEIEFAKDGLVVRRAREVLEETIAFLEEISGKGLFGTIEQGRFGGIKRSRKGGKGLEGVVEKSEDYWNPVQTLLEQRLGLAL